MKILTPISAADEVEMLAENGAEEFYCGVVPREWLDTFTGAIWLNRRSPKGANLDTYESLAELVTAAHRYGIPVFLTLNAPSYTERQLELVMQLARRVVQEIGIDALIVSDLGLLLSLTDSGLGADVHVSSVASALNREAIAFYKDLGASRVILPRALSLEEIGEMAATRDGIDLEAFILNDGCAFEEGLCHTTHHHRVGAFCSNIVRWRYDADDDDGQPVGGETQGLIDEHLRRYHEWIWYLNGCGCSVTPSGLPYGPCGLCAIPELHRLGIASLKIVGREASPLRKLASLKMVKTIVDLVRAGAPAGEVVARAKRIRGMPELCRSGYMCYYRDIRSA